MTSTAVVLGIAMLGTPEAVPDCDCATDAIGSIAKRKGVMNFIGSPLNFTLLSLCFLIRGRTYSYGRKKLLFHEALYEEVPCLHQQLLTLVRIGNNADHHQHPRHAGDQQSSFRQFFFSRLTRKKWREPLTISLQQSLNSFAHGQRLSR